MLNFTTKIKAKMKLLCSALRCKNHEISSFDDKENIPINALYALDGLVFCNFHLGLHGS
jgi:hypothetical protein